MPRLRVPTLGGDRAYADADELLEVAEGNGPVDALYRALLKALTPRFLSLSRVQLLDYKVRILDPELATEATTRVLISFSLPAEGAENAPGGGGGGGAAEGEATPPTKAAWSLVAADTNVISASVSALCDGLEFALIGLLGFECDDGEQCDVTATVHEAVERANARAPARAPAPAEPALAAVAVAPASEPAAAASDDPDDGSATAMAADVAGSHRRVRARVDNDYLAYSRCCSKRGAQGKKRSSAALEASTPAR